MAHTGIDWKAFRKDLVQVLIMWMAGFVCGALSLLAVFHNIGIFEVETRPLILRPIVIDAPGAKISKPTPAATPTPKPVTDDDLARERFKWDYRDKSVPRAGGSSDGLTVDTHDAATPTDSTLKDYDL
jgi:hypothetical protein